MNLHKLTPRNEVYWMLWTRLSNFDRDVGMSVGRINSVAIIELLKLYDMYTIEAYETIAHIETRMHEYFVEESESKRAREAERNKVKNNVR